MSAPKEMLELACSAMKNAYAPYSHFAVGACLRDEDGNLHAGCNVENAAYPLTQCAEASAIGQLITSGKKQITEVLIAVADQQLCPPCGGCRQRLHEFATAKTIVHLCTIDGKYQQLLFHELLPHAFGSQNLENS